MGNFLAKMFCMGFEYSDDVNYDYEEFQAKLNPIDKKTPSISSLSDLTSYSDQDYNRECFRFYDPERVKTPKKMANAFLDYPDFE